MEIIINDSDNSSNNNELVPLIPVKSRPLKKKVLIAGTLVIVVVNGFLYGTTDIPLDLKTIILN